MRRTLAAADVAGLVSAFALAQVAAGTLVGVELRLALILFALTLPAWILVAGIYALYAHDEERADHSTVDDLVAVFHVVTVGTGAGVAALASAGVDVSVRGAVLFWAASLVLVSAGRVAARGVCRRRLAFLQNTVIVGAGDAGQLVARKFLQHPEYGINLLGFVDDDPKDLRPELNGLRVLGRLDELDTLVRLFDVERVVIAFSRDAHLRTLRAIRALGALSVQVDVVPRMFEALGPRTSLHSVEGLALLGLPPLRLSRSARVLKRSFDLVGAVLGLVLTAPLMLYIALRIKAGSPGPVFFRQPRLGLRQRRFTMLKFRTMRVGTDEGAHRDFIENGSAPLGGRNGLYKLDRSDALTPFGRWLRRTSLDELPQLFNVLRGEMSLVGPRPCLPYEVRTFAPHHFARFSVPAGMTGLWQVTARAHVPFAEALDMDAAYAASWSFMLDLKIMLRTARQLFAGGETV